MKQAQACKSCSAEPTGRINVRRMTDKLDACFAAGDLTAAGECLTFWENEARSLGDRCGLLSVLNEEIGFSRRKNDKELGLRAVREARELLDAERLIGNPSGAVIATNIATTLCAFDLAADAIPVYELAEQVQIAAGNRDTYEYAALLNNKSAALAKLHRYTEAEDAVHRAMEILRVEGHHDGEIAVSLINLAHIVFDRDESGDPSVYAEVEKTLDEAWEYINSERQPHDGNYAFLLSKCAPSLRYFGREDEADALEAVVAEIYGART